MVVSSGTVHYGYGYKSGSTLSYKYLDFPELDKVDSAKLTDFEVKKVYELTVTSPEFNHAGFHVYVDAKAGKFIS